MDNGEGALSQNMFTRTMSERGAVKNFREVKVKGNRTWKGLGVGESAPKPPSQEDLPPTQNTCKTEERDSSVGHFFDSKEKFSSVPPTQEGFPENDQKVPHVPQTAPQVVTDPSKWTVGDHEIEYMPEGE